MEARAATVIKRASLSPQPSYRQGLGLLSGPGQTHKSKQPWGDGGPSQRHTGTHMHVVDAVATYCSPVVTKVILNRWVPHLKCGREERRSPSRNRGGVASGAHTWGFADMAQLLFVIQGPGQPLKIRTYHSVFWNMSCSCCGLYFWESMFAQWEEDTCMGSLRSFDRFQISTGKSPS